MMQLNSVGQHEVFLGQSHGSSATGSTYTGMLPSSIFQKRVENIDWKKIAAVDVERIKSTLDVSILQENISHLTFCNITAEVDMHAMDPNYIKLFQMAQLTIEYLLVSQDYLYNSILDKDKHIQKVKEEQNVKENSIKKLEENLTDLKKESHKRKKLLVAQQQIMHAGTESYHKCTYCPKAFLNSSFLQSHITRRHSDILNSTKKQEEEQLAATAHEVKRVQQALKASEKRCLQLEVELDRVKEQLRFTEGQLTDERNAHNDVISKHQDREKSLNRKLKQKYEMWKKKKMEEHNEQIKHMEAVYCKELKEMEEKKEASDSMVEKLQKLQAKRSNLGPMVDDDEVDGEKKLLQQQRSEVAMLKEELENQMSLLDEEKAKQQQREAKYKKEIAELKSTMESSKKKVVINEKPSDEKPNDHKTAAKKSNEHKSSNEVQEFVQEDSDENLTEDDEGEDDVTDTRPVTQSDTAELTTEEMDNTMNESTLGTTAPFGTGTMSLSGTFPTPYARVEERLASDPQLLNRMKIDVLSTLERDLRKIGIEPGIAGISDDVFQDKMSYIDKQRQVAAQKYNHYVDIRQQFLNEVELHIAAELKNQTKKPPNVAVAGGSRRSSTISHIQSVQNTPTAARRDTSSFGGEQRLANTAPSPSAQRHQPQSMQQQNMRQTPQPQQRKQYSQGPQHPAQQPQHGRSQSTEHRSAGAQPGGDVDPTSDRPVPTPRSISPPNKMYGTLSSTGTMSSTHKSNTLHSAITSTQWDSTVSSDASELQHVPTNTATSSTPVYSVPHTRSAHHKAAGHYQQKRYDDDDDDDDEDDDVSDVDDNDDDEDWDSEMLETLPSMEPGQVGSSHAQPAGKKVRELTRSIELQLSGRGKKPAGAVSTVAVPNNRSTPSAAAPTPADRSFVGKSYDDDEDFDDDDYDDDDDDSEDDDDDLGSLSSIDEGEGRSASRAGAANRRPVQYSIQETEYSTNTYSSMWGTTSKDHTLESTQ